MYHIKKTVFGDDLIAQIIRRSDDAAIPIDEDNADYQAYLTWIAEGNSADVSSPTEKHLKAQLSAITQHYLDSTVRERNYDGILSLCSYVASENEKFAAESREGVLWRDKVWARCYELVEKIVASEMPVPSPDEFIAMLPVMAWPE